ncbi:reverse transcriptase family protein [Bradyrhizobium sp. BR 1433]|uniref:reverse transcriptase family protein n=1 Tax=Bradyrhizobium sp. BR 1433 TaxID=3447967 RepID=UPI003EE7EA2F
MAAIERIRRSDPRMIPVLTLKHLSELTGSPYGYLRRRVGRLLSNYRRVWLKKRVPGRNRRRLISIPPKDLLLVQQWIAQNILCYTTPSRASFAYHPDSSPVLAAQEHCGCQWLLKVDIEDFFHSVTERQVAAVFFRLGYPRLLAFELARLTTMMVESPTLLRGSQTLRWPSIPYYQADYEGVLPQGAPTSPMLSNLVMRDLDERLLALSAQHGMRYTRYADDLAFSTLESCDRKDIDRFKRLVLIELAREGFQHNRRKTVIRGPGARRIVLGMLVDGAVPRLPREFKDMLRLHLHYLSSTDHGPSAHALHRRTSVSSLYHHVRGLIGWAVSVEPDFGGRLLDQFNAVDWPPVQPRWVQRLERK